MPKNVIFSPAQPWRAKTRLFPGFVLGRTPPCDVSKNVRLSGELAATRKEFARALTPILLQMQIPR